MITLADILIGGVVVAIVGGVWFAWKHRKDDWDDLGGPYL